MKVLVTGGAGFIGSHLVRALLPAGHEVRVLDNLHTGSRERLRGVLGAVEFREGDVRDPDTAARAVRGIDGVLHQAAIPSVHRSLADPVGCSSANVEGTVTLLQACREAGVRRLVFASSSSVYGDSPVLPKVETMPPAPLSPYAVGKLAAEQYCRVFASLGYVETVSLRYFNVFGPGQDPASQYAAVVPRFITAALAGKPIPLNGDGTQSRDFTYVANVVQANLRALETPDLSGAVFNIGCGERVALNDLIRELGELLGRELEVRRQLPRPGDVPHSLADISRARQHLAYEPQVGFREGLRRTLASFCEPDAPGAAP